MRNNQIKIFLIFLLFDIIFCDKYLLSSYEVLNIPSGEKEYSYQFENNIEKDEQTPVILLKSSGNITFSMGKANEEKTSFEILPGSFQTINTTEYYNSKIKILIKNENDDSIELIFIDPSKEIKMNIEDILNWNYTIEGLDVKPSPLIFNLDSIDETTTIFLFEESEGMLFDTFYDLDYCINVGNECNFNPIEKKVTLETDKKYKIRLNIFGPIDDKYSYGQISITKFIKEVGLGPILFNYYENIEDQYYIVDVSIINNIFYYYALYNGTLNMTFLNEDEKKSLINGESFNISQKVISDNIETLYTNENKFLIFSIKDNDASFKSFVSLFTGEQDINLGETLEIKKGNSSIICAKFEDNYIRKRKYAIVTSCKGLILYEGTKIIPYNSKKIITNIDNRDEVYVDSSKADCKVKLFSYGNGFGESNIDIYTEDFLYNDFSEFTDDSIYERVNSNAYKFNFSHLYYYGLDEQYYFYVKKYYGNNDYYLYKKELDEFSDINEISKTIENYDSEEYDLINNKLTILSGYELLSYLNTYDCFYDYIIQKVDDSDRIQYNEVVSANIFKILNKKKTYYIDFEIDHLIALDTNFSDAEVTFTDENNNEYILNPSNPIMKDLNGKGVTVTADKEALIYFYKNLTEIMKTANITIKEFDKNNTGKIMKINFNGNDKKGIIIKIIKDFGFYGYAPMGNNYDNGMIKIIQANASSATAYIENLNDKLECDLLEGQTYLVHLFAMNEIKNIEYVDNLLTPKNKYNFEVISGEKDGLLILNNFNNSHINYQLYICKNNEISFKIENDLGVFKNTTTINKNKKFIEQLQGKETLAFSFESNSDFLFAYSFIKNDEDKDYRIKKYDNPFIQSISYISKNKVRIYFSSPYENIYSNIIRYYIIIAKKDDTYNLDNFSNECYLASLMIKEDENILLKTIYEKNKRRLVVFDIDISKLNPAENDELVMSIISSDFDQTNSLYFYEPKEFKLEKKEAIEFKLGEKVNCNPKDRDYFKLKYNKEKESSSTVFFGFSEPILGILLTEPSGKYQIITWEDEDLSDFFEVTLNENGDYYFEFFNIEDSVSYDNYFSTLVEGGKIKNIDLSERIYSSTLKIYARREINASYYEVENIANDIFVYFIYKDYDNQMDYSNPFEICEENNKCTSNTTLFKFLKDHKYKIYVHFVQGGDLNYYSYLPHSFFPIFEDTIQEVNEGYYTSLDPKIYYFKLKGSENGKEYVFFEETQKGFLSVSNETEITAEKLGDLDFHESNEYKYDSSSETAIVIIIPTEVYQTTKVIFTSELVSHLTGSTIEVPANHNMIILFDENKLYENNNKLSSSSPLNLYNILTTYSSPVENMKFTYSNETDVFKDILLQNNEPLPIYVNETDENISITVTNYNSKSTIAAAIDNYYIKTLLNYLNITKIEGQHVSFDYFKSLFPMNLRINSDYTIFYEFFNLLSHKIELKTNIHINKYYGETELYECNGDSIDLKNLTILTRPISKCEDKKSIFNRMFSLDGTTLLAGYLGHNSYFDIYIELDDDNDKIGMTYFSKKMFKNVAKYLKKDKEYTLDFTADHLVKLDPDFDAEVTIYKDNEEITKLNSDNLTYALSGNNYKIKANNDTMIYFYSKLKKFKQIEIEDNGQNFRFKITSKESMNLYYALDFGFKGYNPMNIELLNDQRFWKNEYYYLENIYKKTQTKLVKDEKLFLYYMAKEDEDEDFDYKLEIEYINENINNKNNEYIFNVIESDKTNSTLIINNGKSDKFEKILYQVNFCKAQQKILMKYEGSKNIENRMLVFDKEHTSYPEFLDKQSTKITFEAKEDFIFSYSYLDLLDNTYYNSNNNEVKELNDLVITEVTKKTNDTNKIIVKFKPNYKNCSTKYIIVIATIDEENTKEKLSDFCYVAKLATEKPKNVVVSNYYDAGEDDEIEAEVDITDIIKSNKEYKVNIISQQLRYTKKINFYGKKSDKGNEENEDENKSSSNKNTILIIVGCIVGVIILLIAIFLIVRYVRKKKENKSFDNLEKDITNEKLLQEM